MKHKIINLLHDRVFLSQDIFTSIYLSRVLDPSSYLHIRSWTDSRRKYKATANGEYVRCMYTISAIQCEHFTVCVRVAFSFEVWGLRFTPSHYTNFNHYYYYFRFNSLKKIYCFIYVRCTIECMKQFSILLGVFLSKDIFTSIYLSRVLDPFSYI